MKFDTYNAPVRDNVYIQVYASFADPVNIGRKETFTCSTLYERFVNYSFDVFVLNYYGKSSFSKNNSDIYDRNLKEINRQDLVTDGPWFADDDVVTVSYASAYKDSKTTQKCAAARVVQEIGSDGTIVDNEYSMDFKMGTEYMVTTGWRTWSSLSDREADHGADGSPFTVIVHELSGAIGVIAFTSLVISNAF